MIEWARNLPCSSGERLTIIQPHACSSQLRADRDAVELVQRAKVEQGPACIEPSPAARSEVRQRVLKELVTTAHAHSLFRSGSDAAFRIRLSLESCSPNRCPAAQSDSCAVYCRIGPPSALIKPGLQEF